MSGEIPDDDPRMAALIREYRAMELQRRRTGGSSSRYLNYFRRASLAKVVITLLGPAISVATAEFITLNMQHEDFLSGARGALSIPSEDELQVVEGTLNKSIQLRRSRVRDWEVARLARDDASIIPFSCTPGEANLDCLIPSGERHDYLVGRRIQLKYFTMPRWMYPPHLVISDGRMMEAPAQPATIAMEISELTPFGTKQILTYDQSSDRLSLHARSTSHYQINWYYFLVLLATLGLLPPALRRFAELRGGEVH